jgi:nucleotide-binding universal stress UspA family protein
MQPLAEDWMKSLDERSHTFVIRMWQEQREIVDDAITALEKRGVKATGHVVGTRKATRAIVREAAQENCQVIVMAADPRRNRLVADMLWSQEPYRVQRRAEIPVYLVTED